jgi:membrane fusion protein (multidrug efflux system)
MRWTRVIILLVILGVIFGGVFAFIQYKNMMIGKFLASRAHPVIAVTAERVQQETWKGALPAVGNLRAVHGVELAPEVAGVVKSIAVKSGETVKKGDLVVQLDADIETANRNSALAQLKLLQDQLARTSKLPVGSAVSEQALKQTRFQMEAQQATVNSLDAQISKKAITAPFGGRVGIINVDLGQFLQAGAQIATLQDISSLQAEFSVGQQLLSQLQTGQTIAVTADARPGLTLQGKLTSFDPRVDPSTGMISCEGLLGNPKAELLPGMFVHVTVETAKAQRVLTVSQAAISYNLFGDYVYVVKPPRQGAQHPTVQQAQVTLGERRAARVAVLKGLRDGDLIVTSGQLKLSNGTPAKVQEQPLPTPNVAETNY